MEMKRVNDIIAEYPGEWVAVEVLEYDPTDINGDNNLGKLVAHSVDEREVRKAARGHRSLIAITYSGPLVDPGMAVLL